MPQRIARKLHHHIRDHPTRLAITSVAVLVIAFALLGFALASGWDASRQGRIDNCRAINELSRKIYVTLTDAGFSIAITRKFIPSQDCEAIP